MHDEDFNEEWKELEKLAREKFETVLHETKRMWLKAKRPNTKKKALPIVPIKILIVMDGYQLPLCQSNTFDVFGTPAELAQMFENRINKFLKDFEDSPAQRNAQNRLFVELCDKHELFPKEIYPLLEPNYPQFDTKAKRSFRSRLKTYYKRVSGAKRATKG
jgi:hypothetical protein